MIVLNRSALLLLLLMAVTLNARADFVLLSQNALHLGYNSKSVANYVTNKVGYLKANIIPVADITLFQEVMKQTDPSDFKWNALPTTYEFWPQTATQNFWPNLKGLNRYKEAYMTVAKTNKIDILCYGSLDNTVMQNYGKGVKLIRPPDVMLIRSKGSANITWILNYHAIFGKNKQQRLDEAEGIEAYIRTYLTQTAPAATPFGCATALNVASNRVVIGGDWNLSQSEVTLKFPTTHYNVYIDDNTKTSLTSDGTKSSNYDHFVATTTVTLSSPVVFAPQSSVFPACPAGKTGLYCGFRVYVSDHLGIKINVVD